mgnify:CR=1 FL=1
MNFRLLKANSILVILALLASFLPIQHAAAQSSGITFLVNNTADVADHTINGICSAGFVTGGPCTLRAATMEAGHQAVFQEVTIKIPTGTYNLTIPPTSFPGGSTGDLDMGEVQQGNTIHITAADLSAPRPVIEASAIQDGIFYLRETTKVVMTHLTLTGGKVETTSSWSRSGGAIYNAGKLELNSVIVIGNSSVCAAGFAYCYHRGGGIANYGSITIKDSDITLNEAHWGAAIYSEGSGEVNIVRTRIFSNLTHVTALEIEDNPVLNIVNSSISNNGYPGGYSTTLRVHCCTKINISSSTFVHKEPTGFMIDLGSLNGPQEPIITIHDSILFSDSQTCKSTANTSWAGSSYNIANDGFCTNLVGPGDLQNTDPMISMAGSLFGIDPVHLPLPGSPALNHRPGNCSYAGAPLLHDQRGIPRADSRCDTGAFERNFPAFLPAIRR